MSKIVVVDCATGTSTTRDMTAAEEAQRTKDVSDAAAQAAAQKAAADLRIAQRQADLATVKAGPAALGYSEALGRLLEGRA